MKTRQISIIKDPHTGINRTFSSIMAAAALCMVLVGSTVAAAAPSQAGNTSSKIIGAKVENQQGQKLGKIADVVASSGNGSVPYCVLSVKHGLFAKARLVAVPLAAFQPGADGSHLILNAHKDNLAKARRFNRSEWSSSVTALWGAEPAAPVQLPPSEVYGTAMAPVALAASPWGPRTGAAAYPWVPEPAWGSPPPAWGLPPAWQPKSDAIDSMHFENAFGYRAMPH